MTKPHPHADKIIQLANDPTLKVWEDLNETGDYEGKLVYNGKPDIGFPTFNPSCLYHVGHTPPEDPEVFTFSYTGPAPWRVEPPDGTPFWYVDDSGQVRYGVWDSFSGKKYVLAAGNCWKTEADAIAYRDAFKAAATKEPKP